MSFFWEVQEIDKLKDISVSIQVKRDHTALQESEPKEDTSKELEEEDDLYIFNTLLIYSIHLFLTIYLFGEYYFVVECVIGLVYSLD